MTFDSFYGSTDARSPELRFSKNGILHYEGKQ